MYSRYTGFWFTAAITLGFFALGIIGLYYGPSDPLNFFFLLLCVGVGGWGFFTISRVMGIEVTNGGIKIKPLIGEVKLLKNIKSMRIGSGHRSPDILIVEHFGGTTKVWGIDYFDIKEEALIKELEEHCKVKVCWVDGRPMHWENGDCFPD